MAGHHHAAIASIDLAGFIMLGVLGSFGHCVGMCAPFVMFVSRRFGRPDGRAPLAAQAWYHAGRILTYVTLGAIAGGLGGAVEMAGRLLGLQRAASVIAGAVLIATALAALTHAWPGATTAGVFGRAVGIARGRMPGHPLLVGLFLGLLPCGLLYSAVVAAVSRGGAVQGGAALACFGLGTVPALLGVSFAETFLSSRRALVNTISQVFILSMGAWFLWSGLLLR